MSTIYQIDELEEINVSLIRSTTDETNLERGSEKDLKVRELAENIKQNSLIQPITVIESTDSNAEAKLYDVVVGNRRFEAWKMAFPEKPTIRCLVLPSNTTPARKGMLTISENLLRLDYDPQDKGKIIKQLLPHWSNDRLRLAKALGYETASQINEWIDMLDVSKEVIEKLRGPEGLRNKRARLISKLPQSLQVPAAEALNERESGDYDARKFVNYLKAHPTVPPQEAIEILDAQPKTVSVHVKFSEPVNEAIENAMNGYKLIKADMIIKAVKTFLKTDGYLDAEDQPIKKVK